MARQKVEDNLFYVIFRQVPTRVTVTAVIGFYVLLRWLLPLVMHGSLWAQMGAAYAPWLTFMLALFAAAAEIDKYQRRRLLSRQSSLETLRGMTWQQFEHLVGEVYRQQGYKVEEKGGSGPDGGVDVVLRRGGETVLVQCKQWKTQSVGVKPLRELRGVVASQVATRGVFVTCGSYTSAALSEFADQPLELIDGPKLLKLVQEVQKERAPQPKIATVPAAAVPMNETRTAASAAEPACPQCGSPMKRKTARQGANAGNDFWGCSQYPRCRGTRPI